MEETEAAIEKKHQELRAQRDAFVDKFVAALKAKDWTVTGLPLPTVNWGGGHLIVNKPAAHKTFQMVYKFTYSFWGSSRYSNTMPDRLQLKVDPGTSYRVKAKRYTKLDDKLVQTLVEDLGQRLESVFCAEKRDSEARDMEAKFSHRRVMELAGHLNPPGTRISILPGDGPMAGRYQVRFCRGSITSYSMTREQAVQLMAVLNEIQGSSTAFIIVGKNARNGSESYWQAYNWWVTNTPALFATEEEANAMLPQAKAQSDKPESVEVVPYTSRFTIKPGNPVDNPIY